MQIKALQAEATTLRKVQIAAATTLLIVIAVAGAVLLSQSGGIDASLRSVVAFATSAKGLPFLITCASIGGVAVITLAISSCVKERKVSSRPLPPPAENDAAEEPVDNRSQSPRAATPPPPLKAPHSAAASAPAEPAAPFQAPAPAAAAPGAPRVDPGRPSSPPPPFLTGKPLVDHVKANILSPIIDGFERILIALVRSEHRLNKSSADIESRVREIRTTMAKFKDIYPRLLTNRQEAFRGLFMTALDSDDLLRFLKGHPNLKAQGLLDYVKGLPLSKDNKLTALRNRLIDFLKQQNPTASVLPFHLARKAFDEFTANEFEGKNKVFKDNEYAKVEGEFVKDQIILQLMAIVGKVPEKAWGDLPDTLISYVLARGWLKNEVERLGNTSGLLEGLDLLFNAKDLKDLETKLDQKLAGASLKQRVHVKGILGKIKGLLDSYGGALAPGMFRSTVLSPALWALGLFVKGQLPQFSPDPAENERFKNECIAGVKVLVTAIVDSIYFSVVSDKKTPFQQKVRGVIQSQLHQMAHALQEKARTQDTISWGEAVKMITDGLTGIERALLA